MPASLKRIFIFVFVFFTLYADAQEGVRNTAAAKKPLTGKIMLVPFEPKLYMSEIDQKINMETKWGFEQMREYFRHQLDNQLKQKLQAIESPVVTFYTDSAKTSKDLDYIYKSTRLTFDLIDKPTAPASAPAKKQEGIKNGQVAVEIVSDRKFTNTRLSNNELFPFLVKKYQSQYFVFINELDIRTLPESYDLASDTYQREVTVHYTIMDQTSKLVAAGAATSRFSSKINDPKKIVSQAFSPIATYIAGKLSVVMKPKAVTPNK